MDQKNFSSHTSYVASTVSLSDYIIIRSFHRADFIELVEIFDRLSVTYHIISHLLTYKFAHCLENSDIQDWSAETYILKSHWQHCVYQTIDLCLLLLILVRHAGDDGQWFV